MVNAQTNTTLGAQETASVAIIPTVLTGSEKFDRSHKRGRGFFDVTGRDADKPKRVRGRIGGETSCDEHWLQRRGEVRDRVAARQLAAMEFTSEQIGLAFERESTFA